MSSRHLQPLRSGSASSNPGVLTFAIPVVVFLLQNSLQVTCALVNADVSEQNWGLGWGANEVILLVDA